MRYEFRISAYQAGRSFYRRSGQLMLWYTHELMDEPGQQFGEALLRVMKALGSVADSDAGRARWRRAVALVLERVGLTSRFDWDMGPA